MLFADGVFNQPEGKTAHGIIRHSTVFHPVAVVDRTLAPGSTKSVLPETDIPVVDSVESVLDLRPDVFVVALTESDYGEWKDGVFRHTPKQPDELPEFWRDQIHSAVRHGLHIVSCLHQQLARSDLAERLGVGQHIVDIRRPYENPPKYSGRRRRSRAKVVHVMGSDCVIGKRTAALQMRAAADRFGIDSGYIGTGQTCMLVGCDNGAIVDRTPVFQAAGLVERLIEEVESERDLLFIKNQASVLHPAFGGLASAILQGSQADAVVFVHDPGRRQRYHWEHLPVGDLETEIGLVEELGGAPVAAIATRGEDNVERLRHIGLPVADPLASGGSETLLNAALKAAGSLSAAP
ncbi:DUF1611 domain-containing protein [Streptomyces sp. B93]|uniref:DUF1611 domain-containing protein n=1 Tax=Streptomyces sp. B93 TaxID=2824875 RepID=UPI001B38F9F6|nr:DUF1611 domain-containing protein [Streptomyces sp. B93]MBQ1092815.1 DUF1611 domain-containing protein [Streptomyces sp. B93]